MDEGRIVGMIDESDLLLRCPGDPARFREPVGAGHDAVSWKPCGPTPAFDALPRFSTAGLVAIVADDERF